MRLTVASVLLAAGFGSYASAAVSQQCPDSADPDLCYSLNIPDTTASSGNGDIFFQISAPSTYQWVGLGQGSGMAGANIFVVYTSANGQNVTLSPRLGKGHVMPLHDTEANVTLLEGSGVSNGKMIANVKCSNCNTWTGGSMEFNSSSASWIYAAKAGTALDSDDPDETIAYHDVNAPFDWDLTSARGGSDVNPFVSTGTATAQPTSTPSTQSSSSKSSLSGIPSDFPMILMAHGILAGVAFALIFPIGGIIIRVASFSGLPWVHAAIQMLAFLVFTAAFGLGIYIASKLHYFSNHHPIIGIVVFGILVFQPILGILQHMAFKKTGRRSVWSFAHLGIGRVAIILGIINGGLGLQLAGNASTHWIIAYSVVGGVFGLAYIASAVFGESKRAMNNRGGASGVRKNSDRDVSMDTQDAHHDKA